jgi:hypothetical protein
MKQSNQTSTFRLTNMRWMHRGPPATPSFTDEEIATSGYWRSSTTDSEHPVFLTIRAERLKEAKRYEEVVAAYTEAVRLTPHVRAYCLLPADTERIASEHARQASAPQNQTPGAASDHPPLSP